jgi:hypothetical protein
MGNGEHLQNPLFAASTHLSAPDFGLTTPENPTYVDSKNLAFGVLAIHQM